MGEGRWRRFTQEIWSLHALTGLVPFPSDIKGAVPMDGFARNVPPQLALAPTQSG